jgi:hypothetical protein
MRQHFLSHAAHDEPGDAAAAVRGHEDQVAVPLRCGGDDARMRRVRLGDVSAEGDAGGLGRLADGGDVPLADVAGPLFHLVDRSSGHHVALAVDLGVDRFQRAIPRHAGAGFFRERNTCLDGLGGNRRAVGGNEDMPEHDYSFRGPV